MTTPPQDSARPVALITGASRGLGLAVARELADQGWNLLLDSRGGPALAAAAHELGARTSVVGLAGDVSDPAHREELGAAVDAAGRLDVLLNNASVLGPSPLRALSQVALPDLVNVFEVNTFAPLALIQRLLPALEATGGRIVNISSDAAVEAYAGWGAYGSAKAALDQLTAVLVTELPHLRVYGFDPGDMATDLHQQAYPGEDISDRPSPASVVPSLVVLLSGDRSSGRYRASELQPAPVAAAVPA